MYIAPSTNMRLLRNVPLNKNYEHTLYFKDSNAQKDTFLNFTKHTLTKQTYQRVNNQSCRVNLKADDCYDCNYMMFQNENYGNKWFYAFITSVDYVNNSVCIVNYEIDVIQTWLFDFQLKECFVEREHSVTDVAGDNILPEPVELGEYVLSDYSKIHEMFDTMVVIVGVLANAQGVVMGRTYDNIYSGVAYYVFKSDDTDTINSFLSEYYTKPDDVVIMYMCPSILLGTNQPKIGERTPILSGVEGWGNTLKPNLEHFDEFFGNYLPKNKKLLTYPYTYYHIDNNNGASLQLRFEFFVDNEPKLRFDSTMSTPVKISCRPANYKGAIDGLNTETITLDNYPLCSWSMESYSVWLAQNIGQTAVRIGGNMIRMGVGAITGGLLGFSVAASGIANSFNVVQQFAENSYKASVDGDMLRGNFQNSNLNVSHNMQNFYHGQAKITEEYAKYIDDFFTVFGYACQEVKIPNISARPHWNYTKTSNCLINGQLPSDDIDKICTIFNNGVTFWKNISEIGNYSLDNSPS